MVQVLLDPGGSQPPSNPFSAYDPIYDEVSKETGIPAAILKAQTMQESSFDPSVVSKTGGVGLMQIQPSTAMKPGYGVDPIDPARLTDPADNIRFGARYLAARAKDAGVQNWNDPNEVAKGLTAYNGGGDPNYVQNVFRHLKPPGGGADAPANGPVDMYGRPLPSRGASAQAPQEQPATPQAAAQPQGAPTSFLTYANQGATRNKPLQPELVSAMGFLPQLGVTMRVTSGGQEGIGEGKRRTGSTRHDHGGAGDVQFMRDGKALSWENPQDVPVLQQIVRQARQNGVTGIGAGPGYMNPTTTHIGFGKAAIWGAQGGSPYPALAEAVDGVPIGSAVASAHRNPTIVAAAERGRGPAADRPARGAMITEGPAPVAQRQMVDTTSADNAGVLEFLRQQAGQGQETFPQQTQGGLGGLGGFRAPVGSPAPASAPASLASAPASRSVESLIPAAPRDPFAIIGKGAAQNQEWEAQRQGRVALAKMLVEKGATPEQAIGMINSPAAMQLFLGEDNKKLEREKFDFQKENVRADNKRADDAAMSAPRKILRDLGIEPGHPEYIANYKKLAGMGTGASAEVAQRKTDAEALGLTPDKPAYQSYVLTGKMPREDAQPLSATDKKAIMESDEGVMAAESAIKALREAKTLSPKALGGVGAGWKAAIANNLWDGVVPDGIIGSPEQGKATVEMENLVTSNALSQMKAIFGGNPTEGERKILLDIQGSANMPDRIRQPIFDRAIALAERRLEFNKQRAGELRGNTYYKAGERQAQPSGAPAAPAPAPSQPKPEGQPQQGGLAPGTYTFNPATGKLEQQ